MSQQCNGNYIYVFRRIYHIENNIQSLWKWEACVKTRVQAIQMCPMRMEETFQQSPKKSLARVSRKLEIPKMTAEKVLIKQLIIIMCSSCHYCKH